MLSTSKVEVVPIVLEPHGNADTLSVVTVLGGYPCVVRSTDWAGKSLGAYIPPDSVVDVTRPEFAFLAKGTKTKHRVRCVKLRGVQSFGLLMPAPEGAQIGDDVAAYYGVEHYEPEMRGACTGGEAESPPAALGCLSRYEVDSLRRYATVFQEGEAVIVTEKLHGCSARYSFVDGRMWCGSRGEWKREEANSLWWKAMESEPSIRAFCEGHPGHVLYGEVYGQVQSLKYGTKPGEVRFAAFDVLKPDGSWMAAWEGRGLCEAWKVPCVPLLSEEMPFHFDAICAMSDGPSLIPGANHYREGCVVKPLVERWHQDIGRVCLKVVGAEYLDKS